MMLPLSKAKNLFDLSQSSSKGSFLFDDSLSREQVSFFAENGYLHLEQVVSRKEILELCCILEQWVEDIIAQWRLRGLIRGRINELGFESRLYSAWLNAGKPRSPQLRLNSLSLLKPKFAGILAQEKLQHIAKNLLRSPRVSVLENSHYRAVLPEHLYSTTPWHQDVQCLDSIVENEFVTVWIPLVDIDSDNSCLEIASMGRSNEMYERCIPPGGYYVGMRDIDIEGLVAIQKVCMRRGDILCLNKYVPHRSLVNSSRKIRWSIDIRYQRH